MNIEGWGECFHPEASWLPASTTLSYFWHRFLPRPWLDSWPLNGVGTIPFYPTHVWQSRLRCFANPKPGTNTNSGHISLSYLQIVRTWLQKKYRGNSHFTSRYIWEMGYWSYRPVLSHRQAIDLNMKREHTLNFHPPIDSRVWCLTSYSQFL